jgi:hypothetical protein
VIEIAFKKCSNISCLHAAQICNYHKFYVDQNFKVMFSKLAYFVLLLSIPFCRDYTVLYQMTMTKKRGDL